MYHFAYAHLAKGYFVNFHLDKISFIQNLIFLILYLQKLFFANLLLTIILFISKNEFGKLILQYNRKWRNEILYKKIIDKKELSK